MLMDKVAAKASRNDDQNMKGERQMNDSGRENVRRM